MYKIERSQRYDPGKFIGCTKLNLLFCVTSYGILIDGSSNHEKRSALLFAAQIDNFFFFLLIGNQGNVVMPMEFDQRCFNFLFSKTFFSSLITIKHCIFADLNKDKIYVSKTCSSNCLVHDLQAVRELGHRLLSHSYYHATRNIVYFSFPAHHLNDSGFDSFLAF